ncbi:neuromodulin [Gavia stellata]|uniref:neuromodulin n=1 Tax=Gavia stellata TaxID=37040 RepID=UPI002898013F|nr:neuromodulin [Gavia stellata]
MLDRQLNRNRVTDRRESHKTEILTYVLVFSSALLPCSSSKVEKNEDGDQKIEQDGIKPEDKAHKAATKIQASFRGHITRKKLKGEKKGDAPASETDAADKKEEGPAGGAAENKESEAPTATEAAAADSAQLEEGSKDSSVPVEEKKGDGAADTGSEQPAPQAATPAAPLEEKPAAAAETESATKASTDNSPSLKADEAQDKEEPKQADVPAADTTATTTPAAEDATAKATAQPQMETVESSQTEEKTDAVEETKPTESAQQEEVKEEESKADQENA